MYINIPYIPKPSWNKGSSLVKNYLLNLGKFDLLEQGLIW